MSIFSRFLTATRPFVGAAVNNGKVCKNSLVQRQSVRWSGDDHREMHITASRWAWNKSKDEMHLYIWGALIPIIVLIHGVNIFIGPAELAETPEGYVPEYYEYYKHPITRWFAKHVYEDHQGRYERTLDHLQREYEKMMMKRLETKVRLLQKQRADYQGNYYVPMKTYEYAQIKIYEQENLKEAQPRL